MSKKIRKQDEIIIRPKPPEYIEGAPEAVLIDLDGTLAINNGHRTWYEESKVHNDEVNLTLVTILESLCKSKKDLRLIYISGRNDSCSNLTRDFIEYKAKLKVDEIFMRRDGDQRRDSVIKKELYENHIKGKYNVIAVFDDRLSVCTMWYNEGLPLFRLGDPTYEF